LIIDHAATLCFLDDGPAIRLRIATTIQLVARGEGLNLEPNHAGSLAPLLGLLRSVVATATVTAESVFILNFDSGQELRIPPSDDFESWDLLAEDGSRLICTPGGEIVTWGAG
jgi:hypothetical protein